MRGTMGRLRRLARSSATGFFLLTAPLFLADRLGLAAGSEAPAPGGARAVSAAPAQGRKVIVVCAPGYPGNTVEAQPTMDLFAKYVEKAAGLAPGSLGAVYHETEKGGLDRLA